MKKRVFRGMLVTMLVLFLLPGALKACEGETEEPIYPHVIIESFINAVGGRKAVGALSTRLVKGKIITDFRSRDIPIYEERFFRSVSDSSGKCLRTEYTNNGEIKFSYDGTSGWRRDQCGVKKDNRVGWSKLDWILNPRNAMAISRYFHNLDYMGIDTLNGSEVHVVQPQRRAKEHYTLYFDTETHLLVQIGNYWIIEDYREVDGVLFPHKIITSRKGGSTTYEFLKVIHTEPIRDHNYRMQ